MKVASREITVPQPGEAAEFYLGYISQAGEGHIVEQMASQSVLAADYLRTISEERSLYRYAPQKWSFREVLSHINDSERIFAYRALWFARGFDQPLPGFDQDIAVAGAGPDARTWASHLQEFGAIRAATLPLFQHLPQDAWTRRGIASGSSFTVRALAYIIVGHVNHHLRVLRELYQPGA